MLYRLGLRSAQLSAHNWANNFADSCCAPPKAGGLNERGREVVREMNRLGMVINVSHASDETIRQTLEVSTQPIVATHHGLRSFNDIPRNMPDELVRKLAAKGGVIGFQIGNDFHNRKAFEWRTAHAGKPFWDTSEIARSRRRGFDLRHRPAGGASIPDGGHGDPRGDQADSGRLARGSGAGESNLQARTTWRSARTSTEVRRRRAGCATSATCRC